MLRLSFSVGMICLQVALLSGCNSTEPATTSSNQSNAATVQKFQDSSSQSVISAQPSNVLKSGELSNQEIIITTPVSNTANYAYGSSSLPQSNHTIDFRSEYDAALRQHSSASSQNKAMEASLQLVNEMQNTSKETPKSWNAQTTPQHGITCTWVDGKSSCSSY